LEDEDGKRNCKNVVWVIRRSGNLFVWHEHDERRAAKGCRGKDALHFGLIDKERCYGCAGRRDYHRSAAEQ